MKRLAPIAALMMMSPAMAQDANDPTFEQVAEERTPLQQRADDVVGLINGEGKPAEMFTESFLAAVPEAQLSALIGQLTGQFGSAISVESLDPPGSTRGALSIRMERAIARGGIAIDATKGNRISELLFQSFEPIDDSPAKIEADLQTLPGRVTVYFGPLDEAPDIISIAPDALMPLGSTMKLYVLAALGREIAQGKRSWADTVMLDVRSFPSGQMQDWPAGAPVTLHTLASMMISISDNTATDQLIALLGQPALADMLQRSAHSAPDSNAPWLTTRELFALKGGDRDRLNAYTVAAPAERQQILDTIAQESVTTADVNRAFANGPLGLDAEWFASNIDLVRLFQTMRAECDPEVFAIMAINPSAPSAIAAKWDYIGYKGGSEPGVLNLTWLLRDKAGADHMLSLSWANPDAVLEEAKLELIAQRILSLPQ